MLPGSDARPEGDDDRRDTLGRASLLAALTIAAGFGGLLLLHVGGVRVMRSWPPAEHTAALAFTVSLQCAAMIAGVLALPRVPARGAPWVLVAEGALCLASWRWPVAPWFAAGLLAWFVVLRVPWPRPIAPIVPVIVQGAFLLLAGLERSYFALVFSLLFAVRVFVLAWQRWQDRAGPLGLREYLVYVLAPPLVAIPPFLTIVPFFRGFEASFDRRLTSARVGRAAWQLALGVAFVTLEGALAPPLEAWRASWSAGPSLLGDHVDVAGRVVHFVVAVLCRVAAVAHLGHGLLLLHGFEDRLPIDRPLLARSYADLWRRLLVHQKDLQVAFFYTPVLLRLRRRSRYLAIALAIAWTVLVGNLVLHLVGRDLYDLELLAQRWPAILVGNLVMALALVVNLSYERWRAAHPRAIPRPKWVTLPVGAAARLATFALAILAW